MTPTYHIVSHSHWDREWYKSFEQFRAMLVTMVDDLLELLQRDEKFRYFTLDGQTIVLEDYLAVRPERGEELRRLIRQGRIVIGPWYVLPDEFLVSAEATVRNLMIGTRMARSFGRSMNVGYIPDSFGHIAMMPAILRGFNIDAALVYRGFGGEAGQTTSEYSWQSPDGSHVLMHHLYRHGYSAGYFHQESDEETAQRFAALKTELDERARTSQRLLMNGGDHHWPDPTLPSTLAMLGRTFEGNFEHSTVENFINAVRTELGDLPQVKGELRFGYRYAFAVMGGVYSSRMYLKQANWRSQNLLQRYAEPLSAFARASGRRSQSPLVHRAWKTLLQNHPHDSICGCSIDQVHREMMTRFRAADELSRSVVDFCAEELVHEDDRSFKDDHYLFFFNPSPFTRSDIAEANVAFYLQDIVVGLNPDVVVAPKLPPVKGFALLDEGGAEVPFQILERQEGYDIAYSRYNYPKQTYADKFRILVHARDLPPLGFKGLRVERRTKIARFASAVRSGSDFLENEYLRVQVRKKGGVITISDKRRGKMFGPMNVFEDSGDVGDEYNYSYPRVDQRITSLQSRARVRRVEHGPLRASLRIDFTMRVPARAAAERTRRSPKRVTLRVSTVVSLSATSQAVHFETTVDNRAEDHRFRVLFPAGVRTDRVLADSQFCVVERQQKRYDTRSFTIEHPARVAPMQRFVTVQGRDRALTLITDGLPEYELLLDGKGTIALTLLRCVGTLAREDLLTRPGGKAGWHNDTPDAQCAGVHTFRYALLPHDGREAAGGALVTTECERFQLPPLPVRRKCEEPLPLRLSFMEISDGPLTLSALKEAEDGDGVILRVTNPTMTDVQGTIRCAIPLKRAWRARLDEEIMEPIDIAPDGALSVRVGASGVMTLKLNL